MIMKISAIVLIAVIAGVAVTGVLGFSMIPWLRKLKFGGTVLDSEDNKLAVPTMGGLMIIIGTCSAILLAVLTDKISGGSIVEKAANMVIEQNQIPPTTYTFDTVRSHISFDEQVELLKAYGIGFVSFLTHIRTIFLCIIIL